MLFHRFVSSVFVLSAPTPSLLVSDSVYNPFFSPPLSPLSFYIPLLPPPLPISSILVLFVYLSSSNFTTFLLFLYLYSLPFFSLLPLHPHPLTIPSTLIPHYPLHPSSPHYPLHPSSLTILSTVQVISLQPHQSSKKATKGRG